MKNEIASIVNEIAGVGADVYQKQDLISGGYLDSFSVLILVSQLEERFKVSLEFGEDLFIGLDSVDSIADFIQVAQQGAGG